MERGCTRLDDKDFTIQRNIAQRREDHRDSRVWSSPSLKRPRGALLGSRRKKRSVYDERNVFIATTRRRNYVRTSVLNETRGFCEVGNARQPAGIRKDLYETRFWNREHHLKRSSPVITASLIFRE